MDRASAKTISQFLSYTLRHAPGDIGLTLDTGGWAEIDELLAKAPAELALSRDALDEVVAGNDKKRFTISPDGARIRAAQGHSIEVDLGLTPMAPPETLYHGTGANTVEAVIREGLSPQSRRQVHLSSDAETARAVGGRHGRPVVLTIRAGDAHRAGQPFQRADNGVWLTDALAPEWIEPPATHQTEGSPHDQH